jgi:hypothetical protein
LMRRTSHGDTCQFIVRFRNHEKTHQ